MKPAAKAKDPSPHWVFTFGAGRAEGDAAQRDLLGGKGAYLAEMSRLGLPVPPGLTISSEVCTAYYRSGKMLPAALMPMVSEALDVVGKVAGARFGDVDNPLLVSVRSGSRASMPGPTRWETQRLGGGRSRAAISFTIAGSRTNGRCATKLLLFPPFVSDGAAR